MSSLDEGTAPEFWKLRIVPAKGCCIGVHRAASFSCPWPWRILVHFQATGVEGNSVVAWTVAR